LIQEILGKKKVWNSEAWWWNTSRALARFFETSPFWKKIDYQQTIAYLSEERMIIMVVQVSQLSLCSSEISVDRVVNKLFSFIYSFPDKERSSKIFNLQISKIWSHPRDITPTRVMVKCKWWSHSWFSVYSILKVTSFFHFPCDHWSQRQNLTFPKSPPVRKKKKKQLGQWSNQYHCLMIYSRALVL